MASKRHQHASTIAVAALAAAVAAAPAGAATRIGSSLTQRANLFLSCGTAGQPLSQCTVAQTQLGGVELVVPSHGVIVRWRVRSAGTGSVRLRVLQPAGGGGFTAVESSAPGTMSGPGGSGGDRTYTFPTRLPVDAGEIIGVDHERRAGALFHSSSASSTLLTWEPPLADLETRAPTRTSSSAELLLNADIEADADGDGYGDETQDNCPSIANPDQSRNPCPSTAVNTGGGGGTGGEGPDIGPTVPSRGFRRHRHGRHGRQLRGRATGTDAFRKHRHH